MRLNATKELIATAFSPASEASENNFNVFSTFLISKRCVHYGKKNLIIDANDMLSVVDTVWCSHGEADQKNIIQDENYI
jgi:hypothetical protein